MRAVVTRVREAAVAVGGETVGAIGPGFLVLLGVGPGDTGDAARRLAEKVCHLRVFEDAGGKMNLDLAAVGGSVLVVSQFTLYADLSSRRPSFSKAAPPELAQALYECFIQHVRELGFSVAHGVFGAHMEVTSLNDGPVTLCFEV